MAETLRGGAVQLNPESVRGNDGPRRQGGIFPIWLPWILEAILAFLLLRR